MSSGSIAAAALTLAAISPQAQAQNIQRAPGMMVQNYPTGNAVSLGGPEFARNQPHVVQPNLSANLPPRQRTPDFNARDIRISAPISTLSTRDFPVQDIRITSPVTLPRANQPQMGNPDFSVRNIRITEPIADIPVQNIRINSPVALPDAYQPHNPAIDSVENIRISSPINGPVPGFNQPHASQKGTSVNATANFDALHVSYTPGVTNGANPRGDVVQVNVSETIINWDELSMRGPDGSFVFLSQGNNLTFVSDTANYTVLNRVFAPTALDPIRFEGGVASIVAGAQGGNVWFYSPGGIIVGGTGRFDVGSLALTTTAIDTTPGFGSKPSIDFTGAVGGGSVIIEPFRSTVFPNGATDNTPQIETSGYMIAWAPRVEQSGSVRAGGNVAYVGANQGTITFQGGLFDIVMDVGTDDRSGVVHNSGAITTGSASTGSADPRAIYLAALGERDPIQMLVRGEIGRANSVSVVNGNIVLSAGGNIEVTQTGPTNFINEIDDATVSKVESTISIQDTRFTSSVAGFSSGSIVVEAPAGQGVTVSNTNLTHNLALEAVDQIQLLDTGGGISATGRIDLVSGGQTTVTSNNGSTISADSIFTITSAQNAILNASNASTISSRGTFSINAANTASLITDTGIISSDGLLSISGNNTVRLSSDSIGGISGATRLSVTSNRLVDIDVSGLANIGSNGDVTISSGTTGQGGTVAIDLDQIGFSDTVISGLLVGGNLTVDASSTGTSSSVAGSIGGDAVGGNITVNVALGGDIRVAGDAMFTADAQSGFGRALSGAATGGTIDISLAGGSSAINVDGEITAETGGKASITPGPTPFISTQTEDNQGGTTAFSISGGQLTTTRLLLRSDSVGSRAVTDIGGAATGGTIEFTSSGGTITVDELLLSAKGEGGVGGGGIFRGGDGFGGTVDATISGGIIDASDDIDFDVSAIGADGIDSGFANSSGGETGNAVGGDITLVFSGGTLSSGGNNILLDASATGGEGGSGRSGGERWCRRQCSRRLDRHDHRRNASFAGSLIRLDLDSSATGGAGGLGGSGFITGDLAGTGGLGGDAIGGESVLVLQGGNIDFGTVTGYSIDGSATGGIGGRGGSSGDFGGAGGVGGNATGGVADLIVRGNGANVSFVELTTSVQADGFGGAGGNGRSAGFGTAGDGGTGGNATGGGRQACSPTTVRLLHWCLVSGHLTSPASGKGEMAG